MRKGALRNFAKSTGKHLCQNHFIKKETLTQVFSCELGKISKNTFTEHLLPTASTYCNLRNFVEMAETCLKNLFRKSEKKVVILLF